MNLLPRHACASLALVVLLVAPRAALAAPGEQRAGDYTIHYNALSASDLPVASTKAYGLQHSGHQGLVIISVSRGDGAASVNVPIAVSGHATTLLGVAVPLKFRNINEGGYLSTLGTFEVPGSDTLRFDIDVTPRGAPTTHLHFTHDYVL